MAVNLFIISLRWRRLLLPLAERIPSEDRSMGQGTDFWAIFENDTFNPQKT